MDSFFVAGQIRSKAAFVTDGSSQPLGFQETGQGMIDFGAPAQAFPEGRSACRHDHEFLDIDGIGSMSPAVEDIHHRDGQIITIDAAEETIEGNPQGRSCRTGAGQRYG